MLSWEADLKSTDAHVIKVTSISLYISQYLSEYIFRVSSSRMDRDNNESKGQGTLLHVIKHEPKA